MNLDGFTNLFSERPLIWSGLVLILIIVGMIYFNLYMMTDKAEYVGDRPFWDFSKEEINDTNKSIIINDTNKSIIINDTNEAVLENG